MCNIFITTSKKNRPTLEELKQAQTCNSHGAGAAWVENGKIHFEKALNMTAEDIYKIFQGIDGVAMAHFRTASSGEKCNELCHPFPLDGDLNALSGNADMVFAHNGTIADDYWKAAIMRSSLKELPPGPWNDSKAFAYLLRLNNNPSFLSLFSDLNKFLTFTPQKGILYYGTWIEQRKGLLTSSPLYSTYTGVLGKGDYNYSRYGENDEWAAKGWKYQNNKSKKSRGLAIVDKSDTRIISTDTDLPVGQEKWSDGQWEAYMTGGYSDNEVADMKYMTTAEIRLEIKRNGYKVEESDKIR